MSQRVEGERSGYVEADGVRLHYRVWEADRPRAALRVVHGMFEHSRRYRELGAAMSDAGISTYALDLRGHGASEGRRGYVRRFGVFLDDVSRWAHEVDGSLPDALPKFMLFHSLGGLIGIRYLEEHDPPLAGAIISSPWLRLAEQPAAWKRLLAGALDPVFPTLPFPSDLDPELLSHDPERVADYRDDPRIHSTITPRLWSEVSVAAERAFEQTDQVDVPLLLLLAGDDRVADTGRTLELARSLTGDVTTRVLDGYYHEVLQEVDRAAVMAEILGWMEARLG